MNELRSRIKKLRRVSTSRRWYVPELLFRALMTQSAIHSALADSSVPSYQRAELTEKIFKHGMKVFGVLVFLDEKDLISKFIEVGQLDDAKLPFSRDLLVGYVKLPEEVADDIQEKQWEFIAPIFTRGTLHRQFDNDIILPFVQESEIGGGAFGDVYETTLDAEHQELGDIFPQKFARKEFTVRHEGDRARSARNHRVELTNLAILNHLKHPNIVGILGSYTWNGRHNLIFPLADTGDLAQFLEADCRPTLFELDETVVIALAAVSSAVYHVHNLSENKIDLDLMGCHHDLRPRNILVSGTSFILADFGLSTFKPPSESSGTPFRNGADDYLAPECVDLNNGFKEGTVRRSSDVWSFGCIIAEVATYIALGRQGIEQFIQKRKYKVGAWDVQYFHKGPGSPNEGVGEWISHLESICPGSTSALLARLARVILCMEQAARPRARDVTFRLQLIALHGIAVDIDALYSKTRESDDSLDMFLEQTRFKSWRHAIGILDFGDEPIPFVGSNYEAMFKFDLMLACLRKFRGDFRERYARPNETQYPELSRLLKANDELHAILSQQQKKKYREYFHIYVMEEDDKLFERIESGGYHVALEKEIRMRANIKHINTLFAKDDALDSRLTQVESSAVEIQDSFGEYHLGKFDDGSRLRSVWVEWRRYGKHGADERTLGTLYDRTARIARVLSGERPIQFRSLDCVGFFHESAKAAFGLVFEIPLPTEGDPLHIRPKSLHELISTTADKYSLWPDLDDRFLLASTLATSLLEFHTVGWFHKNLTASNVVFFQEAGVEQGQQTVREPFLVGFNHSRPDDPQTFTSGISDRTSKYYQHPRYISERRGFKPEFDYYGLGIVLLEIGFWQPLERLRKRYTGTYSDISRQLLEDRVPQLKARMGRDYCEAVRCCIASDFGGALNKEALLQFGERVVARLRENFVQ
ncbi:hypothetical protein M426DRAFT_20126 [Hypoxylon sp. CI-4A]|nr:hypothetical protein M426DRAFT_20126 [Hypoxylon sp. CI-4A]